MTKFNNITSETLATVKVGTTTTSEFFTKVNVVFREFNLDRKQSTETKLNGRAIKARGVNQIADRLAKKAANRSEAIQQTVPVKQKEFNRAAGNLLLASADGKSIKGFIEAYDKAHTKEAKAFDILTVANIATDITKKAAKKSSVKSKKADAKLAKAKVRTTTATLKLKGAQKYLGVKTENKNAARLNLKEIKVNSARVKSERSIAKARESIISLEKELADQGRRAKVSHVV